MPALDPTGPFSSKPPNVLSHIIHLDPLVQDLAQDWIELEMFGNVGEVLNQVLGDRLPSCEHRQRVDGKSHRDKVRREQGVQYGKVGRGDEQ